MKRPTGRLAAELLRLARQSTLSSLHVLFASPEDAARLAQIGLRTRRAVQFHWINRGYSNFDDYLAALTQPKRKKVRAERRRVSAAGISFVRKTGEQISADDWRFFARCYANTYAAHHSTPYLNPQFFRRLAASMREHLLLVLAMRDGVRVAASFALFDDERLYGRYWGTTQDIDCLHFETSYYQMIEFAIERGLRVFEGGAQGEHKHARGFEPVTTSSSHWLAHPAFDAAVGHASGTRGWRYRGLRRRTGRAFSTRSGSVIRNDDAASDGHLGAVCACPCIRSDIGSSFESITSGAALVMVTIWGPAAARPPLRGVSTNPIPSV